MNKDVSATWEQISDEEIYRHLTDYRSTGKQQYLDKIVKGAYGIQVKCAVRFYGQAPLEDLKQESTAGFIKAIHTFKQDGPAKFITYAQMSCINALIDYMRKHSRLVHIPREVTAKAKELIKEAEKLVHELEREYFTPDILLDDSDAGKRLAAGITDSRQYISDPANAIHHHITQPNPDRRTLSNAMLNLPPGERQIIDMYYQQDEPDYKRYLKSHRIPPKHAHQLHEQGLAKLKRALNCPPAG